jgi:hypothetical protein
VTALRKLNRKGIQAFREYLASIRAGAEFQGSPALLYVDDFSSPLIPRIDIEPRVLKTKLAAAKYLTKVLEPLEGPALSSDSGLWSWLALYFFEQLSPLRSGKRRPREDYHYIPSERRPQRHLLAGAYQLYRLHGEHARVLLHPPVHQHGRFLFDLDYRRDLLTNRGLITVVDRLYWDATAKKPKRGAGSDGQPGGLRRLIAVAQQLDLNYDLYGMSALEIEELLPPEFTAWRDGGNPAMR